MTIHFRSINFCKQLIQFPCTIKIKSPCCRTIENCLWFISEAGHWLLEIKTVLLDTESLSHLGLKIWEVVNQRRKQRTKVGTSCSDWTKMFCRNTTTLNYCWTYLSVAFSFLLKNRKFVISRMMLFYIHWENIYSELNKT